MRPGHGVAAMAAIVFALASAIHAERHQAPAGKTPQQVVEELLAADRAFSKASAQTDVVSGLSAMFAPDVMMPIPGNQFARGAAAATAALKGNASNLTARAEWTPIRGGISADGQHGFTFGYMTTKQADGTVIPGKYLSYWVKQKDGWRVAGYKRSRAAGRQKAITRHDASMPSCGSRGGDDRCRSHRAPSSESGCRRARVLGRGAEDRNRTGLLQVRKSGRRQRRRSQ